MSSEPVVEVRQLCKNFPVYDKPHHRLFQMFSRNRRWHHEFEALRNVSFSIRCGETVGIVGRNGSGKSTLLQLICGTLVPSTGGLNVRGRIAALLELGAGFNPEFTGRENVYLNGTVMGLERAEIESKIDGHPRVCRIGEFIDRPVKTYSSGMYVRLAFAVAIHVEPDLLMVDEALSVGDEAFQRKCFARIDSLRKQGCTILFVSHAAATVIELCDRAILLDAGEMLADGPQDRCIALPALAYASGDRVAEDPQQMADGCARRAGRMRSQRGRSDGRSRSRRPRGLPAANEDQPEPEAYFDEGLQSQSAVAYANRGADRGPAHRDSVLASGSTYQCR